MSVMVTGGTGFIGNRIVRKLVERGLDVVCFDLAPPRPNLEPYLDRIKFYRGDIIQMPHLLEAINTHGVDRIIHMAALLPPDTEDRPHFGMLINIQGTNNVIRGGPLGRNQPGGLRQLNCCIRCAGDLRGPPGQRRRPDGAH